MKRREIFWLLLPCLILGGAALWLSLREASLPPSDGKFHLMVEKVEKRPITAKDAANGYDTEIFATLNYQGPKPKWWGQ